MRERRKSLASYARNKWRNRYALKLDALTIVQIHAEQLNKNPLFESHINITYRYKVK